MYTGVGTSLITVCVLLWLLAGASLSSYISHVEFRLPDDCGFDETVITCYDEPYEISRIGHAAIKALITMHLKTGGGYCFEHTLSFEPGQRTDGGGHSDGGRMRRVFFQPVEAPQLAAEVQATKEREAAEWWAALEAEREKHENHPRFPVAIGLATAAGAAAGAAGIAPSPRERSALNNIGSPTSSYGGDYEHGDENDTRPLIMRYRGGDDQNNTENENDHDDGVSVTSSSSSRPGGGGKGGGGGLWTEGMKQADAAIRDRTNRLRAEHAAALSELKDLQQRAGQQLTEAETQRRAEAREQRKLEAAKLRVELERKEVLRKKEAAKQKELDDRARAEGAALNILQRTKHSNALDRRSSVGRLKQTQTTQQHQHQQRRPYAAQQQSGQQQLHSAPLSSSSSSSLLRGDVGDGALNDPSSAEYQAAARALEQQTPTTTTSSLHVRTAGNDYSATADRSGGGGGGGTLSSLRSAGGAISPQRMAAEVEARAIVYDAATLAVREEAMELAIEQAKEDERLTLEAQGAPGWSELEQQQEEEEESGHGGGGGGVALPSQALFQINSNNSTSGGDGDKENQDDNDAGEGEGAVESEADLDMQLSERSGLAAGSAGLLATTSSLDETLSKMEAEIAAMEQLHN